MLPFTCACGAPLATPDPAGETIRCLRCGREQTAAEIAPATSGKAVTSLVLGVLSLFLCFALTGLPAILFGALGLRDIGRGKGRVRGKGMALAGLFTGVLGTLAATPLMILLLVLPAMQKAREMADRHQSSNNVGYLAIAMTQYHIAKTTYPPPAILDVHTGKPLLSWRVALLPYLGYAGLFNQFKLDEPWDGPNNSRLLSLMPGIYALPGDATAPPGYTYYRVFVGGGAAFEPDRGVPLTDFGDGDSTTVLVVEASEAVPWTKPDELAYDPNGPLPSLGGHYPGGFDAGMADGSVRSFPPDVNPTMIRAVITRNGGEVVDGGW